MPVTITSKLYPAYGSSLNTGIIFLSGYGFWVAILPLADLGFERLLLDAEDDELCRFNGRDADDADQASVINVVLSHRRAIDFDEEGFVGFGALQRAASPDCSQKIGDRRPYARPERLVVRLEDDKLGAFVDRLFNENEQPPHVDVFPRAVGSDHARAPYAIAAAGEEAQHIDVSRIEQVLLAFDHILGDLGDATD